MPPKKKQKTEAPKASAKKTSGGSGSASQQQQGEDQVADPNGQRNNTNSEVPVVLMSQIVPLESQATQQQQQNIITQLSQAAVAEGDAVPASLLENSPPTNADTDETVDQSSASRTATNDTQSQQQHQQEEGTQQFLESQLIPLGTLPSAENTQVPFGGESQVIPLGTLGTQQPTEVEDNQTTQRLETSALKKGGAEVTDGAGKKQRKSVAFEPSSVMSQVVPLADDVASLDTEDGEAEENGSSFQQSSQQSQQLGSQGRTSSQLGPGNKLPAPVRSSQQSNPEVEDSEGSDDEPRQLLRVGSKRGKRSVRTSGQSSLTVQADDNRGELGRIAKERKAALEAKRAASLHGEDQAEEKQNLDAQEGEAESGVVGEKVKKVVGIKVPPRERSTSEAGRAAAAAVVELPNDLPSVAPTTLGAYTSLSAAGLRTQHRPWVATLVTVSERALRTVQPQMRIVGSDGRPQQ